MQYVVIISWRLTAKLHGKVATYNWLIISDLTLYLYIIW